MSQEILQFLEERKLAWVKSRIKASDSPEDENQLYRDADEKFATANWIADAARRASYLTMSSHLSKFSHPSAKTSSVIADASYDNDGYLRTGNVEYELDVFGTASALDVYKFLKIALDDGKTILSHLEEDSELIKNIFLSTGHDYVELKQGFMSIKQSSGSNKTDQFVKQVYFPVDVNYHLLSILTASGLLTQIKERIDQMHFSNEAKQARLDRQEKKCSVKGYEEIWDLTTTAFGGTQPQNISILNSKNAGRAYLLPGMPPNLERRRINPPSNNFFKNTLFFSAFKKDFETLNKFIQIHKNNKNIRDALDRAIRVIIDRVLEFAFEVRGYDPGWSNHKSLPKSQRIWLDNAYLEQREDEGLWLKEISEDLTRWIMSAYDYLCKENKIMLGDEEWRGIKKIVISTIKNDQEFLR